MSNALYPSGAGRRWEAIGVRASPSSSVMRRIILALAIAAQSFTLGAFAGETQTWIVVFTHHGELKDGAVRRQAGW